MFTEGGPSPEEMGVDLSEAQEGGNEKPLAGQYEQFYQTQMKLQQLMKSVSQGEQADPNQVGMLEADLEKQQDALEQSERGYLGVPEGEGQDAETQTQEVKKHMEENTDELREMRKQLIEEYSKALTNSILETWEPFLSKCENRDQAEELIGSKVDTALHMASLPYVNKGEALDIDWSVGLDMAYYSDGGTPKLYVRAARISSGSGSGSMGVEGMSKLIMDGEMDSKPVHEFQVSKEGKLADEDADVAKAQAREQQKQADDKRIEELREMIASGSLDENTESDINPEVETHT